MKLLLTFKTPDVVFDSLMRLKRAQPAVDTSAIKQTLDKYVKFGEILSVEFDTQTETCVVLPLTLGVKHEEDSSGYL